MFWRAQAESMRAQALGAPTEPEPELPSAEALGEPALEKLQVGGSHPFNLILAAYPWGLQVGIQGTTTAVPI